VRYPLSSFRVLTNEDYLRGRYGPGEGGPKGIDINDAMNIFVTTCSEQPLAFFDLPAVLESACSRKSHQRTLNQRALELKYELDLLDDLASFKNSRSWRITAPLRWVFSGLRKLSGKSF
jgi:hypothetical protein